MELNDEFNELLSAVNNLANNMNDTVIDQRFDEATKSITEAIEHSYVQPTPTQQEFKKLEMTYEGAYELDLDKSGSIILRASIDKDVVIEGHETLLIPTSIKFRNTQGFSISVSTRRELALTYKIIVLDSPMYVDVNSEIIVMLHNAGKNGHLIKNGDRIANARIVANTNNDYIELNRKEL